jgi:hypothetical protein
MRHRLRHDAVPQDFLHSLRPANGASGLHQNQPFGYLSVRIRQNRLLVGDRALNVGLTLSTVSAEQHFFLNSEITIGTK